jgi:hypothetical protein
MTRPAIRPRRLRLFLGQVRLERRHCCLPRRGPSAGPSSCRRDRTHSRASVVDASRPNAYVERALYRALITSIERCQPDGLGGDLASFGPGVTFGFELGLEFRFGLELGFDL